ncbi:MAG TPA: squalene/phytoene synthase family protein [Rhizomicrobium sp.]
MSPEEAFAVCEATVRRNDPDRYFASLFAPAGRRPLLFALYAFNHEIARAVEIVREPMMGEIRLQWWREAVEEAESERPRAQPVTIALSSLFARAALGNDLQDLINARGVEISAAPYADLAALESHAQATAGALMRITASLLDPVMDINELAREAGTAYGLIGTLRALPYHAARAKTFLPADLLAGEGLAPGDALSPRHVEGVRRVVSKIADAARSRFEQARRMSLPRRVLPAILPASLVPASVAHVMRASRDPLRDNSDVSLFRRQLILFRAATLGHL